MIHFHFFSYLCGVFHINCIMSKTYKDYQDKPLQASEPAVTYGVRTGAPSAPMQQESARNRILAGTMSVDEYFDELISLVRQDYANL